MLRRHHRPSFSSPQTLSLAIFVVGLAGCFPSLPPEDDVGAADTTVTEEVAGVDITQPEDADSATPPTDADTATPPTDADTVTPPDDADTVTPPDDADSVTPPDDADTATPDDTDAGPTLNACGGTGVLTGETLGTDCGPCSDGDTVCDPEDGEKNRTVCVGASELNDCGGCGVLALVLGDDCNECGTVACEDGDTGRATCVEPTGGCEYPLTCAELNCAASSRSCTPETAVDDAVCGGCLSGFIDIGGSCLRATTTPGNVTATRDLADKVTVAWDAADGATAYRVYRCDKEPSCTESDWTLLPNGEVATTHYDDTTTTAAPEPSAPIASATSNVVAWVDVTWQAVAAPTAKVYRYRVTAVAPAGVTAPTAAVLGSRASRAIQSYEVSIDGSAWIDNGTALSFRDAGALAPTLTAGTATASQGTNATHVALALSGTNASAGTARSYRVRAVTSTGQGTGSNSASGKRAAPTTWSVAWERSAGASAESFSTITNATSNTYNDTDAPADGSVRYYRAVVSAAGAVTGYTSAVPGARLPPPGVPGSVGATTEIEDRVTITWTAVPDALGYRVYRNGVPLTTGNPLTGTSYDDTTAPAPSANWAAPTNAAATTNNGTAVSVTWTAPSRPLGATANYQVLAVNAAGDGPLSGAAVGRRARPALIGYQVETSWTGTPASWTDTQSISAIWSHANAPAGVIVGGTATASQGDFKTRVALAATGYSASPTTVSYRVRGVLASGDYTPTTSSVTGYRSVGVLALQWQVSTTSGAGAVFTNISGATVATYDHTTAPVDGSKRYYRLRVTATGATTNYGPTVEGWRLAVVDVSVGYRHACAVMADGAVWCWGTQSRGELGNGSLVGTNVQPTRVSGSSPAKSVAVGQDHTCIRTETDNVECWGGNGTGQLGNGTNENATTPRPIASLNGVVSISAGAAFTCAVLTGGAARCWGINEWYQLGNGSVTASNVPVSLRKSASVFLGGLTKMTAARLPFSHHACAVDSNSDVACWGYAGYDLEDFYFGHLGKSPLTYTGYPTQASISGVLDVSANFLSTCAVKTNGEVWCWGQNQLGQLGLGATRDDQFVPAKLAISNADQIALGGLFGCARVGTTTKTLRCWGEIGGINSETPVAVSGLSNITVMAAGERSMCAVSDSRLYCWGRGTAGILGTGTTTDLTSPTEVVFPQ